MKKSKKTFTLILSFAILLFNLSFFGSFSVIAEENRYGKNIISQLDNSAEYEFVYNLLLDGFKNKKTEISLNHVKYDISVQELNFSYELVINDYPEIFWVDSLYPYEYTFPKNNPNHIAAVYPNYQNSLYNKISQLNSKVASLTSDLSGKTDYEKAVILHDRLAKNTTYESTDNDQNAYGALVEGKAVCSGYSKAYQLLLNKVGIESWGVIGESKIPDNPENEPIPHEWNIVKIDGKWYHTDITWDDQSENTFYAYFNVTTNQIKKDHSITLFEEYLPLCNSTTHNYFTKNNLIYSSVDVDRIGNNLKNNNLTTRIFIDGNTTNFINQLEPKILPILKIAGLPNGYGHSVQLNLLGNELILSVKFIDPNHIHKTTFVKKIEPTCISKGFKEYYKCDCGDWFYNSSATKKIADKNSLKLPLISHKESKYKSNSANHFKECEYCGIIISGTEKPHQDTNKNYKCDICNVDLPKPQVQTSTNNTPPTSNKKDDITSSALKESSQENITSDTSSLETEVSSEISINKTDNTTRKKVKPILPIAIASGVAVIFCGGASLLILKYKNII